MTTKTEIVFHHYDASPFSQKVRELFGIKALAWRSVLTPNMMPKPDLVPLTGGYRRAPVMQIGADIYCDSQVIMAEIERRYPEPRTVSGPSWQVNFWADRLFFPPTVAIVFGLLGDQVDPAFIADREKLSGKPFDVSAMGRFVEPAKTQWRGFAGWIEQALESAETSFLNGQSAGVADVAAHMNIWFLASIFPDLANQLVCGMPRLQRWRDSMGALGQGDRKEISGADAIEMARSSGREECPITHDPLVAPGVEPGQAVAVMADDYGCDPIRGELVAANRDRIVILREGDDLGPLQIHFPRVGFVLMPAS